MAETPSAVMFEGLRPAEALDAFERRCNVPYKTLWITPSWFPPRRDKVLGRLSDPVQADEAMALSAALNREAPLDEVIAWLEQEPREPWPDFQQRREERLFKERLAPMKRQYLDAQRQIWAGHTFVPPGGTELTPIHWFCSAAEPTARDKAFRELRTPELSGCPNCRAPVGELSWRFVELISPVDGAVEDQGWLVTCDRCGLMVHNVFPRADRRWDAEALTR